MSSWRDEPTHNAMTRRTLAGLLYAVQGPQIDIRVATDPDDMPSVRSLFREYAQALGVDLCFQNFAAELAELPGDYSAPRGSLLVAKVNGELAGCCALRPLDAGTYPEASEMKRLFTLPGFRGLGLGRQLVESTLDFARQAGYTCVVLDTLNDMEAARALYEDLGFEEIPPYYHNPIAGAHYLKVQL